MFPNGYTPNLKRGVNLATMRINVLKSHDYHIWLERLLPVMVRGYVPEHVWQVLASNFFCQLCAKELSHTVVAEMERMAPVLLCKLEKIFHPTSSIWCSIWFCTSRMKHEWGGLCRAVGAIQLRDVKRFFELNVKINAKLKHPLQRHTFWRRCQTCQQNTMLTTFLACIIHPSLQY